MNKILCIGEALIDMICTDRGTALSNGAHFLKKAGGAPANVAAAIAALGGKVDLMAKVGDDPFGDHLIQVMQQFKVDTKWMLRDKNHFTTFAFVSLLENGERDFVFNRGADGYLNEADLGLIDLKAYNIIHFGSATAFLPGPLQQAYKRLMDEAIKNNISVSFDPNYRHLLFPNNTRSFIEQSWYFLARCQFFKVSEEEALLLTGTDDLNAAAAQFHKNTKAVFTITMGKEGTLLGIDQQNLIIPSIPVTPVDTTGAGDAFTGAVLYQLSHKNMAVLNVHDWKYIINNANRAGARTCEFMGAMEAFKHLNQHIFNA